MPDDVIDPVEQSEDYVEQRRKLSQSILAQEPLATWFRGLMERKLANQRLLTWAKVAELLASSSRDVVDGGTVCEMRLGDEVRHPTNEEVEWCRKYAASPLTHRALQLHLSQALPELAAKMKPRA